MRDWKCNRLACIWFLYPWDFNPYNGQHHWKRIETERKNCPKNCKMYIEKQKILEDVKRLLEENI